MQQLYIGRDRLDAVRFRNFLAQAGIAAEIREVPATVLGPASAVCPTGREVWVADEQAAAARELIEAYASYYGDAHDDSDPTDDDAETEPTSAPEPIKVRIPWLTFLFCVACLIPSVGLMREAHPKSISAIVTWGWREALDVADGSYWAIFTSVLLHPTVDHLLLNLGGILILGVAIERALGRAFWLGLFVAGTLVSVSVELAIHGQMGRGASGVLYAMYGFTLFASARRRLLPIWLLIPISIWLLYGTLFDVANGLEEVLSGRTRESAGFCAHLGGLCLGILWAIAFVGAKRPAVARTILAVVLAAALVPLRGSPWLAEWLIARGDRALHKEGPSAAAEWYTRAIARNGELGDAYVRRGHALIEASRWDEAWADYDAALTIDGTIRYAHGGRAQILELRSELDAALDEANMEVREATSPDYYAYAVRGNIHFARQAYDDALLDFEQALKFEPRLASLWSERGMIQLERCQFQDALADADHALWLDSQDAQGWFLLGAALYDVAQLDRARDALFTASDRHRQGLLIQPDSLSIYVSLAAIGLGLFDIDSDPERLSYARYHLERALALAPHYWETWKLRGVVGVKSRDWGQAEADLSRALELNPRDAWAACFRGIARQELNRSDEAFADLNIALDLNPRLVYGFRSRGLVRQAHGQHREAIDDFDRAIELNPRFAEAYQLRGKSKLAVGEDAAGQADLKRAAELDPRLATSK